MPTLPVEALYQAVLALAPVSQAASQLWTREQLARRPANVGFIFGVRSILHAVEAALAYTSIRYELPGPSADASDK